MLRLDEIEIWENLSGPYNTSGEIPPLISKLSQTNDMEIANEIIRHYISHQGSTYDSTLATVPHLVKIIRESKDDSFKIELIPSLCIVLIGYEYDESANWSLDNDISHDVTKRIQSAFMNSLKELRTLVDNSLESVKFLNERIKRGFLISYFMTRGKHEEAEIFIRYDGNDEYVFICPYCYEETYLWNEKNVLNAYELAPPYYLKKLRKLEILQNDFNLDLIWLEKMVEGLSINSLKLLLPYFKGYLNCYNCGTQTNVFEGIRGSV